jgi:hypothetical protein
LPHGEMTSPCVKTLSSYGADLSSYGKMVSNYLKRFSPALQSGFAY